MSDFTNFIIGVYRFLVNSLWPDRRWNSESSLNGKTFVITGGNSGIGLATVRSLAARGAKVIVGCRDLSKGEKALEDVVYGGGKINIFRLNLASFSSIKDFSRKINEEKHIDVLINNAGIFYCPKMKTEDGFEMQMGVNYLGHFMLTLLLIPKLREAPLARVVNLTASPYCLSRHQISFEDFYREKDYCPLTAYNRSKLAVVLFTRELAKRTKGSGINTYCVHPGIVNTNASRHLGDVHGAFIQKLSDLTSPLFLKTPKVGSRTTLYCATEKSIADESGFYYSGCRKSEVSPFGMDDKAAKILWESSERLTNTHF